MTTVPPILTPGLLAAATPVIIEHEGERLKVYVDSKGIPTIGVGLALMQEGPKGLIPSAYAQAVCLRAGVIYKDVLSGARNLTEDQSRAMLNRCIIDVIEWMVVKVFPSFWSYSQPRQIALVDMGFNLGEPKFMKFKQMISCIISGNWAGAANQALHSEWAAEVPSRAEYDAGLLRAG